MNRNWRYLGIAWFAWFLVPLLLVSFTRPFGWWDYLTTLARTTLDPSEFGFRIAGIYTPNDFTQPANIIVNYVYHVFKSPFVLRPTLALLFHLQGLLFGGEFWLWYLAKWAAEFTAIGLVLWILTRRGVPSPARWMIAAVLLFHPCAFELMLCSADGWTALGAIAVIALATSGADFDLSRMHAGRYLALFAAWFLTLGVKENAIVFAILFVLAAHWRTPRPWLRLIPFYVVLGWWIWRLSVVSQSRLKGKDAVDIAGNAAELVRVLSPDSPFYLLGLLFAAALIYGAWKLYAGRDRANGLLFALAALAAGGTLLMSARYYPAPRYNVPVIYLLAVALGLALRHVPRLKIPAIAAALLIPLWQAPNLYTQHLAYQQQFLEYADIITAIQNKMAQGYRLAVTGDDSVPGEWQASIALFFRQFGREFYGTASTPPIHVLKRDGIPETPFVLLGGFEKHESYGLPEHRIRSVEAIRRGQYGIVEHLAKRYTRITGWFGMKLRPTYDLGAPLLSDSPALSLITVDANGAESRARSAGPMTEELCRGDSAKPDATGCSFQNSGEKFSVVRFALGAWTGTRRFRLGGQLRVDQGPVSIGIGDSSGHDLWNAPVAVGPDWQQLPQPPALLGAGQPYSLFLFMPSGRRSAFSIREMTVSRGYEVTYIEPSRRYGAIGM